MDDIKHCIDIALTSMAAMIISLFTWLNLELPQITMWLSFFTCVFSVFWWIFRFYSFMKQKTRECAKKNDE